MRIKKEKIQFFERHLADFFHKAGRVELPWRRKRITAYEVWVSEIMLQQTQVVRVIGYYTNFLTRFPTVHDLAKASWGDFLPYYQGLGYYARGRNMLRTAQVVVQSYDGKFPKDKRLLETLPGIGPYTASAIMSFAYGEDHLAWDTNLKRVIGRFFFGSKHLITDEAYWEEKFALPKKVMNAALMDFGSALCVARPKCEACSLRSRCMYYREKGLQESRIKNQESRKKKGLTEIQDKGRVISDVRSEKTDWTQAQAVVYLHENHRKYYSRNAKKFQPFILPIGYTTRAGIKEYFLKKYGLILAVRPPHAKKIIEGQATILVHAQVLLGEPQFSVFSKKEVTEYNRKSV